MLIAVMGSAGVGKSTFIERFSLSSGIRQESVTQGPHNFCECKKLSSHIHCFLASDYVTVHEFNFAGILVYLVDTPGLVNLSTSKSMFLGRFQHCLEAALKNTCLSGRTYLHAMIEARTQAATLPNLTTSRQLCSTANLRNVVLATMKWTRVLTGSGKEEAARISITSDQVFGQSDFVHNIQSRPAKTRLAHSLREYTRRVDQLRSLSAPSNVLAGKGAFERLCEATNFQQSPEMEIGRYLGDGRHEPDKDWPRKEDNFKPDERIHYQKYIMTKKVYNLVYAKPFKVNQKDNLSTMGNAAGVSVGKDVFVSRDSNFGKLMILDIGDHRVLEKKVTSAFAYLCQRKYWERFCIVQELLLPSSIICVDRKQINLGNFFSPSQYEGASQVRLTSLHVREAVAIWEGESMSWALHIDTHARVQLARVPLVPGVSHDSNQPWPEPAVEDPDDDDDDDQIGFHRAQVPVQYQTRKENSPRALHVCRHRSCTYCTYLTFDAHKSTSQEISHKDSLEISMLNLWRAVIARTCGQNLKPRPCATAVNSCSGPSGCLPVTGTHRESLHLTVTNSA